MKTEKNIFGKGLSYNMADEDKPKYDLPKSDDAPSLDYRNFSNNRQKEANFDRYVRKVYEADEITLKTTRGDRTRFDDLTAKVNGFLQKHAGIDYQEFVRKANPYEFDENDYGAMPKKALRRRLFDHRAYLYLSALADSESEGADIGQLLEQIRSHKIPFIKKEEREPTFQAIYNILGVKEKKYAGEMADLIHLAYSGNLSLTELRDRGLRIMGRVMQEDPEGYDGGRYSNLEEVHRFLDNLHDSFTRKYFLENKRELLNIERRLKE